MVRKIRFTKKADKRFDEILNYLEQEFGYSKAEEFIKRAYSFFDIIVEYPRIGRAADTKVGIYTFVLEKPVTIL